MKRNLAKKVVCFMAVAAFAVIANVPPANAKRALAIKSLDIHPYQEAVQGFMSTVNCVVEETVYMKGAGGEHIVFRLKKGGVDLIFTLGVNALNLVLDKFHNIPVVYSFVLNPGSTKKILSQDARTNMTGISMVIPPEMQFRAILQAAPSVKRVGVVYDPTKTIRLIVEARKSAKKLGLTLVEKRISKKKDAIEAISGMRGEVDAIWMAADTTAITPESIKYMLLYSFRTGIPLIGISDKYVKNGALIALSFDSEDIGKQAGEIASRVLDGEDVASILPAKPRKLKLSINVNTAKKLGLNIPDVLIAEAYRVYK
ncbi:hypothetical protein MNBD_NITROSPINAE01-423 [hydrothermal vent metagenome]|uniref:ABC transporter substrate-binding protein n=1 Tax=hydrothermal vent metagenome TaxID=652676 RepID=A0A3B1CD96_9ZZZZ